MNVQGPHQQLGGGTRSKWSMRGGTDYEGLEGTLKVLRPMGGQLDGFPTGEALPSPPPLSSTHKRPRPRIRPGPCHPPHAHRHAQSRSTSSLSLVESFSSTPPPAYDSLLPSSPPLSCASLPASSADDSPADDSQLDELINLTRSLLLSSHRILREGDEVRESLERIVSSGSPPRTGSGFMSAQRGQEGGSDGVGCGCGCGEEREGSQDVDERDAVARAYAAGSVMGEGSDESVDAVAGPGGASDESSRGKQRRTTTDSSFPPDPRPQLALNKPSTAHNLLSRVAQRQGRAPLTPTTAAIDFDASLTFDTRAFPSPPETPVKPLHRLFSTSRLEARISVRDDAALRARTSHESFADSHSDSFESPARSATFPQHDLTPPDTPRRTFQTAEPPTPSSITSSHFSSSSRGPLHHRRHSTVSSATTSSTFTSTHRSATTASLSLSSFDELLELSLSSSSGARSSDSTGVDGAHSQARDRLKALVDGPAVAAEKGALVEGGEKAAASSSWWGWRQG